MKSRIEEAVRKKSNGYNCAQAILCTYCDKLGISEQDAYRMSAAMGAGMGSMDGTCGAISAACMAAGMAQKGEGNTTAASLKQAREMMQRFGKQNGTVPCGELKGIGTAKVVRSCPDCVKDAATFLEAVVFQDEMKED